MPLEDVTVHRAWPLRQTQPDEPGGGEWVEGEWVPDVAPDAEDARGVGFDCCLFLPIGDEEEAATRVIYGRNVTRPTLLYLPEDDAGNAVALTHEEELLIVAPEINVTEGRAADAEVRWAVQGRPQPFGPPGEDVIGLQARLARVED